MPAATATSTIAPDATTLDGRSARRERGRSAVITAVFELLREGRFPLRIDELAARAGVSEASIFRYFDGIADLQRQAWNHFLDQYAHLIEIPNAGEGPLDRRIAAFVRSRLDYDEQAAPILAVARMQAQHTGRADNLAAGRDLRLSWVRRQFAPELQGVSATRASDLVATIDTLTSPDAWNELTEHFGRSREQIRRSWRRSLTAVIHAWEYQT